MAIDPHGEDTKFMLQGVLHKREGAIGVTVLDGDSSDSFNSLSDFSWEELLYITVSLYASVRKIGPSAQIVDRCMDHLVDLIRKTNIVGPGFN